MYTLPVPFPTALHLLRIITEQSGVYWGLTALSLLGKNLADEMDVEEISSWVMECQHVNGG